MTGSSRPATGDSARRWHAAASADYIAALRAASASGAVDAASRERYRIGTMENPLFPGLFERASTAVGGSVRAAELALEGRIAFNPAGGTHHGKRACASGFCYLNDPVFAILRLLRAGLRSALYVDIDDAGWLVVIKPTDWPDVKATLVPGSQVAAPYEAKMAADGFAGCACAPGT